MKKTSGRASVTSRRSSYEHIGTYHGIEEYRLRSNGLRVLYHHDATAPVVGVMVTYLVGSRHEALGYTGATHILEHLMFKGSKKFPPRAGVSALDRLGEKGALVNATTWMDRTNYYEVLPVEHFDFAVQLEADRMRHAIITEKDLREELPAVRSEYAMGENDPMEALDKHIWATAYLAHPYHHSTIGWLSDIENVSVERLQSFYDTYYWPNNAVVTVLGGIDRATALNTVATHFGVHPASPHPIPVPYTQEPPQRGKRYVEVHRSGTKNLVGVAYKVPEALHTDTPALIVLDAIVAGGTTSRLHRALVEKGLASSVRSVYTPFFDPSLMVIYGAPHEGVSHARLKKTLHTALDTVIERGVTRDEVTRVVAQVQTEMARARDGQYAMLSALNEAIAIGNWKFYVDIPKALSAVTPTDVRRVARTYFTEDTMTVGHYYATH